MRNVKENIGMGYKKSNTKGVSPHLIQMGDELYDRLISEINGNDVDRKLAYETLMDINKLRQMETLPRWDDMKSFLGKCWREAFSHPGDDKTLIGLSGYMAALDFCSFLACGNGIVGYNIEGKRFLLSVLKEVYMSGSDDVRRCIETAVVEGMSNDDLKMWKSILKGR